MGYLFCVGRAIFICALLCISNLVIAKTLRLENGATGPFGEYLASFEDVHSEFSIDTIQNLPNTSFTQLERSRINFGTSDSTYWLRLAVDFTQYQEPYWYITQNFQFVSDITLFYPVDKAYKQIAHKNSEGFDGRAFNTRSIIFEVPTPQANKATYFIRVNSGGNMLDLDLLWHTRKSLIEFSSTSNFLYGLFYGALLALLLYNLFLYYSIKDVSYLYYVLYMLSFFMLFAYINGYLALFTRINPTLDFLAVLLLAPLYFAIVFCRSVLSLKASKPRLDNFMRYLQYIVLTFAVTAVLGFDQSTTLLVAVILNPIVMPMLIVCGLVTYKAGHKPAKYYLLGWGILVPFAILYGLNVLSVVSTSFLVENGLQIAGIWEALLFSLALASKTKEFRHAAEDKSKLSRHYIDLLEGERKSIANEIHDSVSATLVSIKYHIHAIMQTTEDREVHSLAKNLNAIIARKYDEVRDFVRTLRPEVIDTLGLETAVRQLVDNANNMSETGKFKFMCNGDLSRIDEYTSIQLYRIVSEGVANILKHAKATLSTISITTTSQSLNLLIRDNGVGFNSQSGAEGVGLISIRERVDSLKGTLKIDSSPGRGTQLTVSVQGTSR